MSSKETGTVDIADKAAFPGRIVKIHAAADALRAVAKDLDDVSTASPREAAEFTEGSQAPLYTPTVDAISSWAKNSAQAIRSLCDSADNAADTAESKFNAIVSADADTAKKIERT